MSENVKRYQFECTADTHSVGGVFIRLSDHQHEIAKLRIRNAELEATNSIMLEDLNRLQAEKVEMERKIGPLRDVEKHIRSALKNLADQKDRGFKLDQYDVGKEQILESLLKHISKATAKAKQRQRFEISWVEFTQSIPKATAKATGGQNESD